MSERTPGPDGQSVSEAAEELTRSVTDLVGAVFGVGAAVAKTAAEATSGGRPVPEPSSNQGPLNLMIHYGLSAAANLVRTVVTTSTAAGSAAGSAARSAGTAAGAQAASAASATSGGPSVSAGSTLRIPLSIENPGAGPMDNLEFRCLRVEVLKAGEGQKLGVANVRFSPSVLSIAPHDFEKLTVFIDTTPLTAAGVYRAVIGVGTANLESAVQFEVLERAQG